MNYFTLIILAIPLYINAIAPPSTTFTTISNSNWKSTSTWDTGSVPDYDQTNGSDIIIIENSVILNDDLTLKSGTQLTIRSYDTLTINGDVVFSNGSFLTIENGGVLIINGNLQNKNNSDDIEVNGQLYIDGNYSGGNGSEIFGTGEVIGTGSFTLDGSATIYNIGSECSNCSYPTMSGPLPIELVNFNGECVEDGVNFNWTTASEINNDYFNIEQYDSYKGKWISIAEIEGAGNSSEFLSYDFKVSTLNKDGYYRLKQTDFDGEYENSSIHFVECNNSNIEVKGFPNPTIEEFSVSINDDNLTYAEITIYDALGNVVLNQGTQSNKTVLDVSSFKSGVYNVNVVTKYYSKVIRLIKV